MTDTTTLEVGQDVREGVVHIEPIGDDRIAVLRLGAPTERLLTLTEARLRSLDDAITELADRADLRGAIVTGPCAGMFAAGADIKVFETMQTAAQGEAAAREGQRLLQRFGELRMPVVGAIEGPCLGGGLELALALDMRVASADSRTTIGLPEVKLGILPGFGGTQRLSRLIGLPKALDLILQGKMLNAKRAGRTGIVDRVVPAERLLAAAREEIEKLASKKRKAPRRRLSGMNRWIGLLPPLRAMVRRKVLKTLSSGQAKFYPAPKRALECCLDAFRLSRAAGFANEAKALGELIVGSVSHSLVHLFFLTERSKALGKGDDAAKIDRATVIGGGVMGAGIAGCMASRGVRTRLCDLDTGVLAKAKARLAKSVHKLVKRRRLERHAGQATLDRLAVATEWGDLSSTDLFLEAVVEDMAVKRQLFSQAIARGLREDSVIASNTSSLSIDEMAEDLPNPGRVVGMHFFNPPEKMPLVEVIRGDCTSPAAVATVCRLSVALGKFPIVVKNSAGFLVNRVLSPYMNEAALLMAEGAEPEDVDRVMLAFGMPMGPARLMDEVGFDVAAKVGDVLGAAFTYRGDCASPLFARMVEGGHLGQKSGGGLYDDSGKQPGPGRTVLTELRGGNSRAIDDDEILARLVYPMVDEAYRCLDEGIVEAEEDLDLGLVMGTGFPPFRGGISRYARAEGFSRIVAKLDELTAERGPRFAPSDGLRERATVR